MITNRSGHDTADSSSSTDAELHEYHRENLARAVSLTAGQMKAQKVMYAQLHGLLTNAEDLPCGERAVHMVALHYSMVQIGEGCGVPCLADVVIPLLFPEEMAAMADLIS